MEKYINGCSTFCPKCTRLFQNIAGSQELAGTKTLYQSSLSFLILSLSYIGFCFFFVFLVILTQSCQNIEFIIRNTNFCRSYSYLGILIIILAFKINVKS